MSSFLVMVVIISSVVALGLCLHRLSGGESFGIGRWARAFLLGNAGVALIGILFSLIGIPFRPLSVFLTCWGLYFLSRWRPRLQTRERVTRDLPEVLTSCFIAIALVMTMVLAWGHRIHVSDEARIYGANARVFAASEGVDPEALLTLQTPGHIEYPPLISLVEALFFQWMGMDAAQWAMIVFVLFWLCLVLLAHELARACLPPWPAWILTTIFIFTPELLNYAQRGFADLPLTAYVMAAVVHGHRAFTRESVRDAWMMAVYLGCAALTKNEGQALAAMGTVLILGMMLSPRHRPWARVVWIPTVLLGGLWPLYREVYALKVVDLEGASLGHVFDDPGRLWRIAEELASLSVRKNLDGHLMWGAFWFLMVLLWGFAFACWRRGSKSARRRFVLPLGLFLAHLGAYVTVMAMTPHSLAWQLQTALQRLIIHTTPLAFLSMLGAWALILEVRQGDREAPLNPQ